VCVQDAASTVFELYPDTCVCMRAVAPSFGVSCGVELTPRIVQKHQQDDQARVPPNEVMLCGACHSDYAQVTLVHY
jgi:hypothetical protein